MRKDLKKKARPGFRVCGGGWDKDLVATALPRSSPFGTPALSPSPRAGLSAKRLVIESDLQEAPRALYLQRHALPRPRQANQTWHGRRRARPSQPQVWWPGLVWSGCSLCNVLDSH